MTLGLAKVTAEVGGRILELTSQRTGKVKTIPILGVGMSVGYEFSVWPSRLTEPPGQTAPFLYKRPLKSFDASHVKGGSNVRALQNRMGAIDLTVPSDFLKADVR